MRELYSAKNLLRASAIVAASVAVAACGGDEGNNIINACPEEYLQEAKELQSISESQYHLQKGVAQLRRDAGKGTESYSQNVLEESIDDRYSSAVDAVFHDQNDSWKDFSEETKVDDLSEAFCHGPTKDQVFFSPAADRVIGALATVGIKVNAPYK